MLTDVMGFGGKEEPSLATSSKGRGMWLYTVTVTVSMEVTWKTEDRMNDHDSVTAVLCVYLRDSESAEHREICSFVFMAVLPTIARERNQAKCPSVNSLDKENLAHIHNRIIYIHKDKWNDEFCRKVDATENHYVKQNKPAPEWQTNKQVNKNT